MTLPALPPEALWCADGVRYQIMLRVLPVQRHDMLGPLSVVRMALAVLRRRLLKAAEPAVTSAAAAGPDWAGLQGKVNEMEQQVVEAVDAVSALRWWDGLHRTAPLTVADGVAQCFALIQLAMSLRSQQLLLQAPAAGEEPQIRLPVPAMHHALLGLLVHATEGQPDVLVWRLSWDHAALLLQPAAVAQATPPAEALPAPPAQPAESAADRTLQPITAHALAQLLAVSGWRLSRQADAWRLTWPEIHMAD